MVGLAAGTPAPGDPSRMRRLWLLGALLAVSVEIGAGQSRSNGGPLDAVQRSNDVGGLERIASSAAFAQEVQGSTAVGMAKLLRGAAYTRLGAIGTTEPTPSSK